MGDQNILDMNDPNTRGEMEFYARHAKMNIELALIAKYPELMNVDAQTNIANREAIYARLRQEGLPLTIENLEQCLHAEYAEGRVKLPMYSSSELEAFEAKDLATGKHLVTTAQMREYLEKTRQPGALPNGVRPNAAEFLPTAGGRAMDT